VAARDELSLARGRDFLRHVHVRRFEQPISHRVPVGLGQQRRKHVEDVEFTEVLTAADRDGTFEREPVDETPQSPKEPALTIVEQIVTPVEQCTDRLVARQRVSRLAPVSTRKCSSKRSRSWRGLSILTRDAASSIASGIPSSRRQISATIGAFFVR
jgi:hypothetical protein